MAEFLALGITHYPMLAGVDDQMAALLRWTLKDPDIPDSAKDPATWSENMQREWGDDEGRAAAAGHRAELRAGLRRCREALDEFKPDVVIVWGDDQYENFREEVIPPFCILAYDDLQLPAFEVVRDMGIANAWGMDKDAKLTLHGAPAEARELTTGLIEEGVDMAYSYKPRERSHFPHAILNTQLFLDYDKAGQEMNYPFIPMTVNCYGHHVIARKGGLARYAAIEKEVWDPAGPTPKRCFEVGAATARVLRKTDLRVALVASSSWSHAFLCDDRWHLDPDHAADRRLYDLMVAGDYAAMNELTTPEVVKSGQQEILNWYAMLGAVDELGLKLDWSTMVTTDVFNSNKPFAIYS